MKLILATGATENYYSIIWPYLFSIERYSNFDENLLVTLDFEKESEFSKIRYEYLDNRLIINKNPNNCIQHGEFFRANFFQQLSDDDIVCYTDGDITLQRPISQKERELFSNLNFLDVLVQFNCIGGNQTLADEFYNINPNGTSTSKFGVYVSERFTHEALNKKYNISIEEMVCYNTGVVICSAKTWKFIMQKYSEMYEEIIPRFQHYAKQQFLLSLIINMFMKPKIMSKTLHVHYHYGLVEGCSFNNNALICGDELVLFNHICVDNDLLPTNKENFLAQQKRFLEFK